MVPYKQDWKAIKSDRATQNVLTDSLGFVWPLAKGYQLAQRAINGGLARGNPLALDFKLPEFENLRGSANVETARYNANDTVLWGSSIFPVSCQGAMDGASRPQC